MKQPVYTNKKLNFLYNVHTKYTAGIMLEGWEVKSLDYSYGDINTSFCVFKGNNFCLINSKITPDKKHVIENNTITDKEFQDRKLLLNKHELAKIKQKIAEKGYTCVPVKLYRSENKLWKLEIALVTGKTNYDKRDTLKKRDLEREIKNI